MMTTNSNRHVTEAGTWINPILNDTFELGREYCRNQLGIEANPYQPEGSLNALRWAAGWCTERFGLQEAKKEMTSYLTLRAIEAGVPFPEAHTRGIIPIIFCEEDI